jgi:demethylmenaquinone methyltransferase/2-methoxy-6-polyprenyl-1,4-benzoquinol methylase
LGESQGSASDDLGTRLYEQLAYYRARAPQYDLWAERRDTFDRGELNSPWHDEKRTLRRALDLFEPHGRVLEIAGGTGQWTERLIRHTALLTVLDAAPEPLEINRRRIRRHTRMVRYVNTDFFTFETDERFDNVFFSYFLSHVPPDLFAEFWHRVRRLLKPRGRVFFIDNLPSTRAAELDPEETADDLSVLRQADGRTFRVFKILWHPDELRRTLSRLGWDARVHPTGDYFFWGEGRLRDDGPQGSVPHP